jgi:hypothetical protein
MEGFRRLFFAAAPMPPTTRATHNGLQIFPKPLGKFTELDTVWSAQKWLVMVSQNRP